MNTSTVQIWEEQVTIPTYGIGKPDKNPMFFEKRIYQGSSGAVYPNPVIEKIYDDKHDQLYTGLFLENKYIKLMILPQLGGRIQMAYDKIKQRHFIYYNQVIKPALVGLTGPWISGGIEFNWPQHHRPSTFEPIDYKIEENADGSKTIWVNELEKMFHTKGMAGFTLHPDKAYIEIKAQLSNRSALPQTFLWWANPAVKVNDDYQSVFPPDVNAVFDHGKRDVSSFPIATGTYYKVDYSPGTDISMYKNIPVPTSYMAINSAYDFVGGYEHDTQGGLLHVANHHTSPGKKQWTWGHSDFGQAWDRNLTDEDGPYIELMTGMFTDNQPDFSWLMPNEEKSFTQYFLPYHGLGLIKNASKDILLALNLINDQLTFKIYVTSAQHHIQVTLSSQGEELFSAVINIEPEQIFEKTIKVNSEFKEEDLVLHLQSSHGRELLRYEPALNKLNSLPQAAKPALDPQDIDSNEQLYLTGNHLEQYRHATYSPVPYYQRALERDPTDIRNNNALGLWYLRRGQFSKSEPYFRAAIQTSTQRNPNPYDSEPYYNLGLCLKFQERYKEAYDAFYKSTWSNAWKDNGYFAVAQLDILNQDWELALQHLTLSIDRNASNGKSYVLLSAALRQLKSFDKAKNTCLLAIDRDGFNLGAFHELSLVYTLSDDPSSAQDLQDELLRLSRKSPQNLIEYAIDYAAAGLYHDAIAVLSYALDKHTEADTLLCYYMGFYHYQAGNTQPAMYWFQKSAAANPYLAFPNRLEDIAVLQCAMKLNRADGMAPYYLGNLFYDKRQYAEAIQYWERSVEIDPLFPTVLRNLGIAYYNKTKEPQKAKEFYERAFQLDQHDARVLMELDQLHKRLNVQVQERLKLITAHLQTAHLRDDLYIEHITMLNFLGEHENALEMIRNRHFHPWEGGEGKVSGQFVSSLTELAKKAILQQDFQKAVDLLSQAQHYPHNLGEGKLYGTQENDIFYWLGCAYQGLNDTENAIAYFQKATLGLEEPSAAVFYNDQQPDKIFYQGLAWRKLGQEEHAVRIFNNLITYGQNHLSDDVKIDYFAVSLPNLLLFDEDLSLSNQAHCYFIAGLGQLGLNHFAEAKDAFLKVMVLDAQHSNANLHLKMINIFKTTGSTA